MRLYTKDASVLLLQLLQLKIQNRRCSSILEHQEQLTNAQKEKNDNNRLRLENLLYKQTYLHREIKSCKDFTPKETFLVEKDIETTLLHHEYTSDLQIRHRHSLMSLAKEYEERQLIQVNISRLKQEYSDGAVFLVRRATEKGEFSSNCYKKINICINDSFLVGTQDKKRKFLEEIPGKLNTILAATNDLEQSLLPNNPLTGRNRDMILLSARRLSTPLYVLFHSIYTVQISSIDATGGLGLPAGYSCLRSYQMGKAKWFYKADIIHKESGVDSDSALSNDSSSAVDLTLRIESDSPEGTVSTMTIRFELDPSATMPGTSDESAGYSGASSSTPTPAAFVGALVTACSIQAQCPFKPEAMLHNLFPRDGGDLYLSSTSTNHYLWVQWLCGLRPLPDSSLSDTMYGHSAGAVLNKVTTIASLF